VFPYRIYRHLVKEVIRISAWRKFL
jgi:hypothetical protein